MSAKLTQSISKQTFYIFNYPFSKPLNPVN